MGTGCLDYLWPVAQPAEDLDRTRDSCGGLASHCTGMIPGTPRSWDALAASLGLVTRLLCPAAQHAFSSAASSRPAHHREQQRPHRRLPSEGPGLADFLNKSSVGQLPAARAVGKATGASSKRGIADADAAAAAAAAGSKSVFIETYGCQMNVSDTEIISSVLSDQQYTRAASAEEAAVVLLNTCAIRENAEARIWGRLGELQALKRQRRKQQQPSLVVGVLGCMAERLKAQLLDDKRLADLVVGPDAYRDLPRIISAVQAGEARGSAAMNVQLSLEETYADIMPVRQDSSSNSAFVSIMRGCNNMCAFCIVPFTRGHERSRPVDSILREVEMLSEQGIKEVTLLGQNVNSYADFSDLQQQASSSPITSNSSSDKQQQQQQHFYAPGFKSVYRPQRAGAVGFAELLERVASVNPEMRVRFTSPHPKDFTDDVLGVISTLPNVCNYLHMPAQSGSSSVLMRMKRGYTREAYDALVQRARHMVPNVALSTDIITGFCGETEEEHLATVDLLRNIRYDNAFLFSYSERAKTYASRHYPDDIPAEVKSRRLAELFAAYRQGQAELNALEVGRVHLVLLDGRPRRDGQFKAAESLQGRTDSMKRVIIPEQQLPVSLSSLHQQLHQAAALGMRQGMSEADLESLQQRLQQGQLGPVTSVGVGDFVAVQVQQVVGHSTLISTPLAKTSIQEFAAVSGSTAGVQQHPSWLQQLLPCGFDGAQHERLVAQAGQ